MGRVVTGSGKERATVPRKDALRRAWDRYHLAHGVKPLVGAVIIGGAALALATEVGATQVAIGALAAYTTYRMLRYGLDLREALVETVEVEELAKRAVQA